MQDTVEQLKDRVKNQAGAAAQKAGWSDASSGDDRVAAPDGSLPQDLQFSAAAARKEEMVDDLLPQGVPPADMEQKEEELREARALSEPPAGNKAKPVKER